MISKVFPFKTPSSKLIGTGNHHMLFLFLNKTKFFLLKAKKFHKIQNTGDKYITSEHDHLTLQSIKKKSQQTPLYL